MCLSLGIIRVLLSKHNFIAFCCRPDWVNLALKERRVVLLFCKGFALPTLYRYISRNDVCFVFLGWFMSSLAAIFNNSYILTFYGLSNWLCFNYFSRVSLPTYAPIFILKNALSLHYWLWVFWKNCSLWSKLIAGATKRGKACMRYCINHALHVFPDALGLSLNFPFPLSLNTCLPYILLQQVHISFF